MRRRLKKVAARDCRSAALREEIKKLELQAERYLLARLAAVEEGCPLESAHRLAPGENPALYLRQQGLATEGDERLGEAIATLATATAALSNNRK